MSDYGDWHSENCSKYTGGGIDGTFYSEPCDCGWDATRARIEADLDQLRRERDLAIAHDRQPYPTAWAYEQACRVREEWMALAIEAEAHLARLGADG